MNLHASAFGHRVLGNRYLPVRVEDLIVGPMERRSKVVELLFHRLGVPVGDARALELTKKVFGTPGLESHFGLGKWGACSPGLIDDIESRGREGLAHFGYLPWRLLESHPASHSTTKKRGCSVGQHQIQVPGVANPAA